MKVLLTSADIKTICERPTKLKPCATADEYEMERYMNVAREAAIVVLREVQNPVGECPPLEAFKDREEECAAIEENCCACWQRYLKQSA